MDKNLRTPQSTFKWVSQCIHCNKFYICLGHCWLVYKIDWKFYLMGGYWFHVNVSKNIASFLIRRFPVSLSPVKGVPILSDWYYTELNSLVTYSEISMSKLYSIFKKVGKNNCIGLTKRSVQFFVFVFVFPP